MIIRDRIKKDIGEAFSKLTINDQRLTIDDSDIEVTRTADAKFGDFSTNIALKISRDDKRSPLEFARVLADSLKALPYVEKLEVAGPGFINFFIKAEIWQKQVSDVLTSQSLGVNNYGSNNLGKGKKARVEFVSANPTGPLHFGNARGGPIGDVLASVLQFSGYEVLREYFHNDIGGQVEKLGQSIMNVANGAKLSQQEYKGDYILELAHKLASQGLALEPQKIGQKAVELILAEIEADCRKMGITFDKIYPESGFAKSGDTKRVLDSLEEKGVLKKSHGAVWFAPHLRSGQAPSDEFLKDRETVVKKSDGDYTYFANDIAYHNLKFSEGYDLVVDIFGANHHGHVPRLQAAISALGFDPSRFHVILYQWVRFKRGLELVKMSKRSGTFITAKEVLDEVGRDPLRFFILMHDPNSHIDFDLDLAKKKSADNPVYYVQYANARIVSILAKLKVKSPAKGEARRRRQKSKVDYSLLTTVYELDLIKQITRFPELVEDIASSFAVHRLTAYAIDLADSFHRFYENCRVIPASTRAHSPASTNRGESTRGGGEKEDLMQARLGLILATKIALANTLKLLGISAPEKM